MERETQFFFGVDVDDLSLNFLAYGQNVVDVGNSLSGDLGDVDKAVNTRNDLCKCTELCDAYDSSLDNVADLVLLNELGPGVLIGILSGEGNSLLLGIEGLNDNGDLVAFLNDILGVADSVPCQLAGSYQTVNRTDVNEYAVVLDGANLALELLANLNGLPELSSLSVANLSCSLADRADYSVALLVDLDNLELNGLLNQVLKLGRFSERQSGKQG